jgi:hypothetical protein
MAAAAAAGSSEQQSATDGLNIPMFTLDSNGLHAAPYDQVFFDFAVRIIFPKWQNRLYGAIMASLLATAVMMSRLAAGGVGAAQPDWEQLGLAGVVALVHAPKSADSCTSSIVAAEMAAKTAFS